MQSPISMTEHRDRTAPLLERTPLHSLVCEQSRRLLAFWTEKRAGHAIAPKAAIDPLELKFALGHLVMFEVLTDPLRFRYRLTGSSLTSRFGYDLTGKTTEDHPDPDFRALAHRSLSAVVSSREPFAYQRHILIDGRIHHYETVLLPFSTDGETVDVLLCMMWPYGTTAAPDPV